jgi:hypothetical protein
MGILRVGKVNSQVLQADLFTQALKNRAKLILSEKCTMSMPRDEHLLVTADANSDNRMLHRTVVQALRTKTGALFMRCADEEAEKIRHATK